MEMVNERVNEHAVKNQYELVLVVTLSVTNSNTQGSASFTSETSTQQRAHVTPVYLSSMFRCIRRIDFFFKSLQSRNDRGLVTEVTAWEHVDGQAI